MSFSDGKLLRRRSLVNKKSTLPGGVEVEEGVEEEVGGAGGDPERYEETCRLLLRRDLRPSSTKCHIDNQDGISTQL